MNLSFNDLKNTFIALLSGVLLTVMLKTNGVLAQHTTPMLASWVAHGVGMVCALLFIAVLSKGQVRLVPQKQTPRAYYLGGLAGAFTIILASMALNGGVPISTVVALGLVGQMVFALCSDVFGFFGTPKRRMGMMDAGVMVLVLIGSFLVILG